jgi:hypothetical protein
MRIRSPGKFKGHQLFLPVDARPAYHRQWRLRVNCLIGLSPYQPNVAFPPSVSSERLDKEHDLTREVQVKGNIPLLYCQAFFALIWPIIKYLRRKRPLYPPARRFLAGFRGEMINVRNMGSAPNKRLYIVPESRTS